MIDLRLLSFNKDRLQTLNAFIVVASATDIFVDQRLFGRYVFHTTLGSSSDSAADSNLGRAGLRLIEESFIVLSRTSIKVSFLVLQFL